jgi:DNA repair exonuclease SbcCD ATPase subunit
VRQSSDNTELAALRRTIRELERRVEDYETQLAASQFPLHGGEGNSELSLLHRELSAARKKEIDQLKHEASQKETIKSLKRQVADLERKTHEAVVDRFVSSPSSHGGSAQKAEVSELRHQLSSANQSVHDLKKSLREAERKASASARELQKHLDEFEDEKFVLEQALEDAQIAAEESAATHEETLKKYKQKLEKYRRERDELATAVRDQRNNSMNSSLSEMPLEERRDLHKMLRESQLAADKLDRELREHREALEELMGVESSLRKKLERARSERAAYRASAEKLHKDVKKLKAEKDKAVAEAASAAAAANEERALVRASKPGKNGVDTDAIIRAAEAAEQRHEKEIRGMVMQMEWLKACWDREAKLRSDAAYAKQYLMMQVQVRDAWYVFTLLSACPVVCSQLTTITPTATKPT